MTSTSKIPANSLSVERHRQEIPDDRQLAAPAPSIATATEALKAKAPATAQVISSALTGPSAACLIPAQGGILINAPIMAENPTASTARQIQLNPASHTAHIDSADGFWEDFASVVGPLFPVVTGSVAAVGYALGVEPTLGGGGGELEPEVSDILPEGADILELGELGAVALSTAQVDSVSPDDWQEGSVAAVDSSFNQVKGTPLANPTTAVRAGLTAGKLVNALPPGTSVTAVQNSEFLAPRPQPVVASPTVLPSSVISGIAASKALSSPPGGRKMLQDAHSAPPCCNSYTVKQGDTLESIAASYGTRTYGPAILQAINGLPGTTVTQGQTLMLPCGRILAYYTGFNAAAAASKKAPAPTSSG